jgi:hypothetical protein
MLTKQVRNNDGYNEFCEKLDGIVVDAARYPQRSGDPIAVYTAAAEALPCFEQVLVQLVGRAAGAEPKMRVASLKHVFRTLQKHALRVDGGTPTEFEMACDIVRGSIVCGSMGDLLRVLEALLAMQAESRVVIVRVKNRFAHPTAAGWADAMVNFICLGSSAGAAGEHVCELQLVHETMLTARKEFGGHNAYAAFREAAELRECAVGGFLVEQLGAAIEALDTSRAAIQAAVMAVSVATAAREGAALDVVEATRVPLLETISNTVDELLALGSLRNAASFSLASCFMMAADAIVCGSHFRAHLVPWRSIASGLSQQVVMFCAAPPAVTLGAAFRSIVVSATTAAEEEEAALEMVVVAQTQMMKAVKTAHAQMAVLQAACALLPIDAGSAAATGRETLDQGERAMARAVSAAETGNKVCGSVGDAVIRNIARACERLAAIDLSGCTWVTDGGIQELARQCPSLATVNLSGCTWITDGSVGELALNCTGLATVNLSGCIWVTDRGIIELARNCADLEAVNISGCVLVTDSGVGELAQHCVRLVTIHLGGCFMVTDRGVSLLALHCTGLTWASFDSNLGCAGRCASRRPTWPFTDGGISDFKRKLPTCTVGRHKDGENVKHPHWAKLCYRCASAASLPQWLSGPEEAHAAVAALVKHGSWRRTVTVIVSYMVLLVVCVALHGRASILGNVFVGVLVVVLFLLSFGVKGDAQGVLLLVLVTTVSPHLLPEPFIAPLMAIIVRACTGAFLLAVWTQGFVGMLADAFGAKFSHKDTEGRVKDD